jgi:hypothetical protein
MGEEVQDGEVPVVVDEGEGELAEGVRNRGLPRIP